MERDGRCQDALAHGRRRGQRSSAMTVNQRTGDGEKEGDQAQQITSTETEDPSAGQRSVGGVCRTLRNERFAPVQNAHTSFVLKLNKKPFSNFLLSNFVFLYFSATLEAFVLTASRSLRVHRARVNPRERRGTLSSHEFSFTYSSMYVPLK